MNEKLLKFYIQCFLNQVFSSTWDGRRVRQNLSRGKQQKMREKIVISKISLFFARAFVPKEKSGVYNPIHGWKAC